MISAEQALKIILDEALPLGGEVVSLTECCGRYADRDIKANLPLPPFHNSAMDGFGVRSSDTTAATKGRPVGLRVIGTIAAGDWSEACLRAGEAVRIMTGAPVPEGVDAVIPIEAVEVRKDVCFVHEPAGRSQHIRFAGEDIRDGEIAVTQGTRLTPRHVALLASLGLRKVPVWRRPRVAVLATGSELVEVGQSLKPGQIYNSNGPTLQALLSGLGIEAAILGQTTDSSEELAEAIGLRSAGADVLITMGGVSVGDFDLVPSVLERLGARQLFHKVSIKPGKPLLFAVHGKTLVFGLPGNPVSSYMVYDRFIRPALLKMMGSSSVMRIRKKAVVEGDLKGAEGKEVYLRGVVTYRDGRYFAKSAGSQASAMLVPLARANAVLFMPASKEKIVKGETIEFEFLEESYP